MFPTIPEGHPDFDLWRIATSGCGGDWGETGPIAHSAAGAESCRTRRVGATMEVLGLDSWGEAEKIEQAARGWAGLEANVLRLATSIAWDGDYDGWMAACERQDRPGGMRRSLESAGVDWPKAMSVPRMLRACDIARRLIQPGRAVLEAEAGRNYTHAEPSRWGPIVVNEDNRHVMPPCTQGGGVRERGATLC